MAFDRLMKLVIFNYLLLFQGVTSDNETATDGEEYVKRLLNKEKVAEKPEYLIFTAPSKLCEGGCDKQDNVNLAMVFPVFLGKEGRKYYTDIYPNDRIKLNQIFTKSPPTQPYTTCSPPKPTANQNTKSTMYPGYVTIPTHSTGYPGYSQNSGHTRTLSTGFPGYAELIRTWSTGLPGFERLLDEAIRARLGQPEENGVDYKDLENEYDYRNALRSGELKQFKSPWIRRTVAMDGASSPVLIWRPTQAPTKRQDTYVVDLVNRRRNKWARLYGYRPVLPIRDKK